MRSCKTSSTGSFFDSKDKVRVDTGIKKHISADEVWSFPELKWIFVFDIDEQLEGRVPPFTEEAGVGCQDTVLQR